MAYSCVIGAKWGDYHCVNWGDYHCVNWGDYHCVNWGDYHCANWGNLSLGAKWGDIRIRV